MAATTQAPTTRTPVLLATLSDERLARLVEAGHEAAFVAVYRRHHQSLFRFCRSMVGNDADAEDALQATMAGAYAALAAGRRSAPLKPWLFRIAHNESVSLLRRRRTSYELPAEEALPAARSTAEQSEQRARLSLLLADLRELPERQRSALVLRELSGLTHEQIAVALNSTEATAKQTIYEARQSLQQFEEGRAMACAEVQRAISDGDGRELRGRRYRAHVRDCAACAAFAAAIDQRSRALRAVTPALPTAAAAGLLHRVLGVSGSHGPGGAGGLLAGAAGKAAGTGLAVKAMTGVVLVAGATFGVTHALHHHAHRAPPPSTAAHLAAPAAHRATRGAGRSLAVVHPAADRRAPGGTLRARGLGSHRAVSNRGAATTTAAPSAGPADTTRAASQAGHGPAAASQAGHGPAAAAIVHRSPTAAANRRGAHGTATRATHAHSTSHHPVTTPAPTPRRHQPTKPAVTPTAGSSSAAARGNSGLTSTTPLRSHS